MSTDPRLLSDVKLAEGCSLVAYKDSLGYWTIGVGHKLNPKVDWSNHHISQDIADSLLEDDLSKARQLASNLPEWGSLDTECRQNALVELCFNMGSRWFTFKNARNDLEHQDWQAAHDELLDSLWCKQVGPTRAHRLANYILEGEYENEVGD